MINESFIGEKPDPENSMRDGTRKRVSVQIETAKKSSKFFRSQSTKWTYSFNELSPWLSETYYNLLEVCWSPNLGRLN